MGKYAAHFYFEAQARWDIPDEILLSMTKESARRAGYHPTGEGDAVTWYEVSDFEVRLMPESGLEPGDWRIRTVIGVEEDAEITSPESSAEVPD
jgi:hypothetical protein